MKKKTIAILGSTGSIGQSTLDIVKKSTEFKVELLSANKNYFKIINQIKIFKPSVVIVNDKKLRDNGFLKPFKELTIGAEIFNIFDVQNSITNTFVRDVYTKVQYC